VLPILVQSQELEGTIVGPVRDSSGAVAPNATVTVVIPGLGQWDLPAIKRIKVGDRARFQFRGEFFNAFNHNSFNAIVTDADDGNYVQATESDPLQEIQLAGKFCF
jgi:hypothetical protein